MRSLPLFLLSVFTSMKHVQGGSEFRICAFNLHNYGESKSKKNDVMQIFTKIISRCDVCLLQEVRDSREKALPELIDRVKRFDSKHKYEAVASERLGRSDTYKEQYVFVYRTDTATVTAQYQYPDDLAGDEDAFSREPFIVRMKAPQTKIEEFVLIAQHTTPSNATKEIDALYDVLKRVKKMWRTQNIMLLGDFNADCGYLAKKNRDRVRLITDTNLFWLIPDDTDTTVRASTSCAYDRIVVHGNTFQRSVVPFSAKPFNFQKEFRLTEDQALEVSDHYPVEVLLSVTNTKAFGGTVSWTKAQQSFSLILFSHAVFHTTGW